MLFGSSNSQTHVNEDYPLTLAGGGRLGLRHGRYLRFGDEVPLSNLFVTLLHRYGAQTETFADSTGELTDVLG